jgi:hypothetical protein
MTAACISWGMWLASWTISPSLIGPTAAAQIGQVNRRVGLWFTTDYVSKQRTVLQV